MGRMLPPHDVSHSHGCKCDELEGRFMYNLADPLLQCILVRFHLWESLAFFGRLLNCIGCDGCDHRPTIKRGERKSGRSMGKNEGERERGGREKRDRERVRERY